MNLQQKKDNSFLATEPLGKLLLKLSLPTVTAQIINMLYNIVDRIYIGHIPENGALALTGVGEMCIRDRFSVCCSRSMYIIEVFH